MRKFLIPSVCLMVGLLLGAPLGWTVAQQTQDSIPAGVYQSDDGYGISLNLLWTPTASSTPFPTWTMTPVVQPSATHTPVPSVTPFVSPTPEDTRTPQPTSLPTLTPTPTITPTPLPGNCWGVTTANLNARTEPGGEWLGLIPAGSTLTLTSYWIYSGAVWYEHYWLPDPNDPNAYLNAWSHSGWIDIRTPDECLKIPNVTPQAARIIDGFHLLVGAVETVLYYLDDVATLKSLTHSHTLALVAKEAYPRIVIVYRSLYNNNGQIDGPTTDEWFNPYIYWQKLKPHLVLGFDYYEFINEWGGVGRDVIADFNIAMLDYMARDGYCGLAFSEGPGNPEIPAWDEYVRVLRWIDDQPCGTWPDGRTKYHGMALHQTGHMPDWVETLPNSYTKNPWIYARLEIVRDFLLANHHYNLADFKGPIYITEMGWTDYTNPNEEFTCEEVKAGLDLTRSEYLATGLIDGFHIWNFWGENSWRWVDLTPCLPVMYP